MRCPIYYLFLLALTINFVNSQSLTKLGFIGCFKNSLFEHEFTAFSPHSSGEGISTIECQKGCFLMGFELASIEKNNLCFCKKGSDISMEKISDENCQENICPGDPNYYCGSYQHTLVYSTQIFVQNLETSLKNQSEYSFVIEINTEAPILYTINNIGVISSYDESRDLNLSNFSLSQFISSNAVESLQIIATMAKDMSYLDRHNIIKIENHAEITSFKAVCPSIVSSVDNLLCDIEIIGYSEADLLIEYDDEFTDRVKIPKPLMNLYGSFVSQNVINSEIQTINLNTSLYYALSNGRITESCILKSIELYSFDEFDLKLHLVEFEDLSNKSNSGFFQCPDKFSKIKGSCDGINSLKYLNSSIEFKKTFIFHLKKGYNLFFSNQISEFDEILQQNWFILLESMSNGQLLTSSFYQNDTDYTIAKNDTNIQRLGRKIMFSINTEKYQIISSFKLFKYHGNKSVHFQIIYRNSSKILDRVTRNFTVIEPVYNLVIDPVFRSCSVDRLCEFRAKTTSGSDIKYRWTIDSNLTNYETDYMDFKFSKLGIYSIKLDAWNNISFQSTQINYTINEGLQEIYFHAGNQDMSISKTNKSALFLFRIRTVQDYTCVINFGDSFENYNFTDKEKDFNNDYIGHVYLKSGSYSVTMTCYHGIDSLQLNFIHIVQDEISGFDLIEKGVDLSVAFYKIGFKFESGTDMSLSLEIDSINDALVTFDKTTLVGYSGLRINYGYARILNISIRAYNLVSFVSVSEFFEISSSLQNPQLIISPYKNNYVYEFLPTSINYRIKVEKGNNVRVDIFFGNEENSQPSVSRVFDGEWISDFVYTYAHRKPGDYVVIVKVSNAFSNFDFYKRISFISRVDQLTCLPMPSVVLLKFSRAFVEFRVKSIGDSDPGSRTKVKFWPGDLTNSTHGPFMLGIKNFQNKIPLSYTYSQLGNFRPILLIENEISKKYFQLNVMVVSSSVDDMYVVLKPQAVMINQSFEVSVHILNAFNVNITWVFDNVTISQNVSSSKSAIEEKKEFNSGSTVRNAIITVKAMDTFTSKTTNIMVNVQNPIYNYEIYTKPVKPIIFNEDQNGKEIEFYLELNINVTNPFFLVNFDDGSRINFEQEITNGSISFKHFFKFSGIYNVNVTIFNLVSRLSKTIRIEILEDFQNFDCRPTWRLYPFSFSDDYNVSKIGEFYLPRKEYDLRFKCFWMNKDSPIDNFSIQYGSYFVNSSIFDQTNIVKLNDLAEIVITLSSEELKNQKDNQVIITVKNSLFSKSYQTFIKPVSSIKDIIPLIDNSINKKGQSRILRFSFESLGEPSCALITQNINGFRNFLFTIGTNLETCKAYYPYIQFKEKYQTENLNIWFFSIVFKQTGLINIEAFVKNEYSSFTVSTSITVSDFDCNRPLVYIENRHSHFYEPQLIQRSKRFSIIATTRIDCRLSLRNVRQWKLFLIRESNGNEIRQININSNPTSSFSELVIPSKSLPYGLYKFVYKIEMVGTEIDLRAFQVEMDHYVKIIPSGIVVQVFPGGMTKIRRGIDQSIILDPTFYSYDLDSVYPIRNLEFKYFCSIFESGILSKSPQISLDFSIDLNSIQSNFSAYSNHSCFDSAESFTFDVTRNVLTIPAQGLSYIPLRQYSFTIMTNYLQKNYSQNVIIEIDSYSSVPVINIRCKFSRECSPHKDYLLINPVSKLMIIGECESGCEYISSFEYEFKIYKKWIISNFDNRDLWSILNISEYASVGKGAFSNELTILKELFLKNQNDLFKVEFMVKTVSVSNGISLGTASLFLAVNKPPKNGSCEINPKNGFSGSTIFVIECRNWYDSDGFIINYEFYFNFLNNKNNITLGLNGTGYLETVLPGGPTYDENRINVFVKINDNLKSHSIFQLEPIYVFLNQSDSSRLIEEFKIENTQSPINKLLFESNSIHTLKNLLVFVYSLNELSRIDKKSLIETDNNSNLFLTTFGPKTNISYEANFDDINTIMPNFLVSEIINITSKDYETRRNSRASARETIVNFISNISLLDMASFKFKTALMAEITADNSEITRETSIQATKQILDLLKTINLLETIYEQDMIDIVNNLANTMANILQGLSTMINERQPSLHLDYIRSLALPAEYDTDLENFWSNPNNFLNEGQTEYSEQIIAENKNILHQKIRINEAISTAKTIIDALSIDLAEYSPFGDSIQISTTSIQMTIKRVRASDLNTFIFEGLGKIELPSFCDLIGNNQTEFSIYTDYFDWNDLNNCTNELITVQIISKASAPGGFNSDNETKIGLSNSLSIKFFSADKIEIPIKRSLKPIHLFIPRDPSVTFPEFYYVNATEFDSSSEFLVNKFDISTTNASLHIHLKPSDNFIGYFMAIKFGKMPVLKKNTTEIDKWKIFCPIKDQFNKNKTYVLFMNQTEINGYKGSVGVGIRELSADEFNQYCVSKIRSQNQIPDYVSNITFTSDFYLRFYSSGCYYLNEETGWWSSDGIEIMSDTNEKYTHCVTNHLTEFAGGLFILPAQINFDYVFSNAAFSKNPTIYITVIVMTSFYFLFLIWGRYQDTIDSKKSGICLLKDNQPLDSYFYEVIVFSGSRANSETDSRVSIILSGDCDDTKPRILEDPKRKCFRRGGVDSFILSTSQSLGNLSYVRVWHDNSGEGSKASWYLKFILIRDLQTDKKYYFMCQNWFAIEMNDGVIDRILPVVYDLKNSQNLKALIGFQTKQDIADDHIWFSIFARPVQSSFSRVERITCCFVLLLVTMLINILYYEKENDLSLGNIKIGYFLLSSEQIVTGLISSLLVIVPNLILVEIFRKSRRRKPKYTEVIKQMKRSLVPKKIVIRKLDRIGKLSVENDDKKSKSKFSLRLPWWFKIIGFLVSYMAIGISIFFIIIKGIEFGDDKVGKWLSSFFISVISSIFLTQPIKVVLLGAFFVLIFRKPKNQHEDDDKIKLENEQLNDSDFINDKNLSFIKNDKDWNSIDLSEARKSRLRRLKLKIIIKELIIHSAFLSLIYMCAFAYKDNYSFKYQKAIRNLFLGPEFNSMKNTDQFWTWAKLRLSSGLRAQPWYNGRQPYGLAGFANDFNSRLIGYAILRQLRVREDSCIVEKNVRKSIKFCEEDYSFMSEENRDFGFGWSNNSSNMTSDTKRVLDAFKFKNSIDLESYPYFGMYNSYSGGGYVYELRGSLKQINQNLSLLQNMSWVDRKTRAVFAEFTLFNPNIHLLCVSTILIEFLPTGNLVKSARMEPINLFNDIENFFSYRTLVKIFYVLMLIFFLIKEIISLFRNGISYFKNPWSYVEIFIQLFSWLCIGVYIHRCFLYNQVFDLFNKTSGYGYVRLQNLTYWNDIFTMSISFCVGLTTFKFIKLLRFSPRLSFLAATIRCATNELMGFGILFSIVWLSMVQVFYLYFFDKMASFSTIVKSMETCFQIILGKFQVDPLMKAHKILGPIFFILYNFTIVFIYMNLLISIVNETFMMVKKDAEQHFYKNDFLNYLIKKIGFVKGIFRKTDRINLEISQVQASSFQDNITLFPKKSNQLIDLIVEMYGEQLIADYIFHNQIIKLKKEKKEKSTIVENFESNTLTNNVRQASKNINLNDK